MNYEELSSDLRETAKLLQTGQIAKIDFTRHSERLQLAAECLALADRDRRLSAEMLNQFRQGLRRRARATARLRGKDAKLVEQLIDSEQMTLSDLVKLREQIDSEFDEAFSSTLTVPSPAARGDERLAAYKS